MFLDALPLTPNGKVDRRALPAPDRADAGAGVGYVAPRNHVEEVLASIWSQVLGVPQVGIHDNFFAIGGDSIISIQIVARASQLGLRLASRQIFQHQTIAELAGVVGQTSVVYAEQGPVTGALPLTPIQRWFFEHELPERQHWNQAMLLELRAEIAPALIERSIARLIVQHDALRLRFAQEEAGWHQDHAAPSDAAFFRHEHFAALSPAEQNARIVEFDGGGSVELGSRQRAAAARCVLRPWRKPTGAAAHRDPSSGGRWCLLADPARRSPGASACVAVAAQDQFV